MFTSVYLYNPVNGDRLTVWPARQNGLGIYMSDIDLGYAQPRANVDVNASADGTTNYTQYLGPKSVSLTLRIAHVKDIYPAAARSELMKWMSPRLSPELHYTFEGGQEAILTLKASQVSRALSMNAIRQRGGDIQLQWECPAGVAFGSTTITNTFGGYYGNAGFTFNFTFNLIFGTNINNTLALVNSGEHSTTPIVRLYGGLINPSITKVNTNQTVALTTVIDVNTYIELNMLNHTAIRYLSNGTFVENVFSSLTTLNWFDLSAGTNTLQLAYTYVGNEAKVNVLYQPTYL